MTTIVIGGHSRKVGKTAVAAGLIRAFDEYSWTAAKISTHWHDEPPAGVTCVIHEETTVGDQSDSSRFLAAGAARSFWIRIREERLAESLPSLQPILQSSRFMIIESNCILKLIQPELFIMVLRSDVDDFKDSARETLRHANGILMIASGTSAPAWRDLVRKNSVGIPFFTTADPNRLPPEFLDFMKLRLVE